MASRARGRRGHPRGNSRPSPIFDHQAFVEAMGAVVVVIAQASTVEGQGGPNNLQRLIAYHPPAFKGGGDPMVANHWFRQVERFLRLWRSPLMPRGSG